MGRSAAGTRNPDGSYNKGGRLKKKEKNFGNKIKISKNYDIK